MPRHLTSTPDTVVTQATRGTLSGTAPNVTGRASQKDACFESLTAVDLSLSIITTDISKIKDSTIIYDYCFSR
jgi:hypothetical protein